MKTDKFLHFAYGLFIGFFLINIHPYYGFGLVVLIGGGKELIYDKWLKKGAPDLWDFLYTIFPALLILLTRLNPWAG